MTAASHVHLVALSEAGPDGETKWRCYCGEVMASFKTGSELRVALFCDEYDKHEKIFRRNGKIDDSRAAATGMSTSRRAIEGEVDEAMLVVRREHCEDALMGRAVRTLSYFSAWRVRRGGW